MGWNTYYGIGGIFDERSIMSVAHTLCDQGLAHAGYRRVVVAASQIGLPAAGPLTIRDLWTGHTTAEADALSAEVPPRTAALLRVTAARPGRSPTEPV